MKITDAAVKAILDVMASNGMDTKTTFLEIGVFKGAIGLGFTRDRIGVMDKYGDLNVMIDPSIDTTGVVIDFGEIEGKRGLIFLGDENVGNTK